ncbi:hypothetical protein FKW77_008535 [Venturia effusa]|uniref:Uncharacterized protein n=1 Tax=Venturia effusa TaxID=50376 RepID=A0A517L7W7_9PEZI|nr:hypothetical protein FKW77_008535 [Venturia effusa]
MGAIGQLVPLVLLLALVGVVAYFGYQMYIFSNELADRGVKKMEKKNIFIGKDGAKVGVKEVRSEDYEDKTQNVLVKTWNHASFPGFKSRIWNSEATPDFKRSSTDKVKTAS